MKNLIFNFAIVMIIFANFSDGSYRTKKQVKTSKNHVTEVSKNDSHMALLSEIYSFEQENFPLVAVSNLKYKATASVDNNVKKSKKAMRLTPITLEVIETPVYPVNEKTIEEVIAENNAIIESNLSNDAHSLDFVAIETAFSRGDERTIEEVIAEDNAITENSLSNETHSLDIQVIENVVPNLTGKTIEEIIAVDNAVIESNVSTIAEPLDFNLIYESSSLKFKIDNVAFDQSEKTIEEVIAEDNAITENHFSNETIVLNSK